jgi:hypothetical protein
VALNNGQILLAFDTARAIVSENGDEAPRSDGLAFRWMLELAW